MEYIHSIDGKVIKRITCTCSTCAWQFIKHTWAVTHPKEGPPESMYPMVSNPDVCEAVIAIRIAEMPFKDAAAALEMLFAGWKASA